MKKELITNLDELQVPTKVWDVRSNMDVLTHIVADLGDTLESLPDTYLYLASNQIGYSERAMALRFKDEIDVFLNPSIKFKDKQIIFREKDPITGKEYFIPRYSVIDICCYDAQGKLKSFRLNEAAAIVTQQALNTLNGLFDSDWGLEIDPDFDELSDDDKSEILAAYVDSLKENAERLDKELTADPKTAEKWTLAKYVRAVADGEVEFQQSNRKKRRMEKLMKKLKKINFNKNNKKKHKKRK